MAAMYINRLYYVCPVTCGAKASTKKHCLCICLPDRPRARCLLATTVQSSVFVCALVSTSSSLSAHDAHRQYSQPCGQCHIGA